MVPWRDTGVKAIAAGEFSPLLLKEGWTRHQEKCREASFDGADGVVDQPPRLRRFGGFAPFSYWRSHPSFKRRGIYVSLKHSSCKFKLTHYPMERPSLSKCGGTCD